MELKIMELKKILFLLLFAVILTGCTNSKIIQANTATVPNIFEQAPTVDSTDSTDSADTTKPVVSETKPIKPFQNVPVVKGITYAAYTSNALSDEKGIYMYYDGGEVDLELSLGISELEDEGVGLWLFVDGKAQPYHTKNDIELTYWKTLRPSETEGSNFHLFFTPEHGKAGETLEIFFLLKALPDETITTEINGDFIWTKLYRGIVSRLIMNADPKPDPAPQGESRLLSCSLNTESVSSSEMNGWSSEDLQQRVDAHFFVNGSSGSFYNWNYSEDTISFRMEIFGAENAKYGLTLFLNNEPLHGEEETIVSLQNGVKTIIESEVDITGLDECSLFAVLSPMVYRENGWDDSIVSDIFYFATFKKP